MWRFADLFLKMVLILMINIKENIKMDSNEEKRVWGIHTLNDALFLNDNIIAIGWRDMGDLKQIESNRDAFK